MPGQVEDNHKYQKAFNKKDHRMNHWRKKIKEQNQ